MEQKKGIKFWPEYSKRVCHLRQLGTGGCLRVIDNHPRRTPTTSHLHDTLNIETIRIIIHRLPAKFVAHCPSHPKPLVQQIGNYTVAINDRNMYCYN
jgi:hypothetical protein